MRTRFAWLASATFLAVGVGFTAAAARIADRSGSAGQRAATSGPQQSAATSMVVYKSPT